MYAEIKYAKNIGKTIGYSELKVQQEKAQCLLAENFVKDLELLSPGDKLWHFTRLSSLHDTKKKHVVHASLNFHPSEKLSDERLRGLAREYMGKIGFEHQPYLVYRHNDAGHPHLHVVSTLVRMEGPAKKINFNHSLKVVQEMERTHNLVKSQKIILSPDRLNLKSAQRVIYGEAPTKAALGEVLALVIPNYRYTSLQELNAVLRLYNVQAETLKRDAPTHRHRGLIYKVLDENEKGIGVPIKSSEFDLKPTLNNLEQRFWENQSLREPHRQHVQTSIDWIMTNRSYDLPAFQEALAMEHIAAVVLEDKAAGRSDIFYVDHANWSVFDGEGLGEQYNLKGMQNRFAQSLSLQQEQQESQRERLRLSGYL